VWPRREKAGRCRQRVDQAVGQQVGAAAASERMALIADPNDPAIQPEADETPVVRMTYKWPSCKIACVVRPKNGRVQAKDRLGAPFPLVLEDFGASDCRFVAAERKPAIVNRHRRGTVAMLIFQSVVSRANAHLERDPDQPRCAQ